MLDKILYPYVWIRSRINTIRILWWTALIAGNSDNFPEDLPFLKTGDLVGEIAAAYVHSMHTRGIPFMDRVLLNEWYKVWSDSIIRAYLEES